VRIGYSADYLHAAFPERFGRREHERWQDHVQRLAQDGWLLDSSDAELGALCSVSADDVAAVRDRMARDFGLAKMLRHARETAYALGMATPPAALIHRALAAYREAHRELEMERLLPMGNKTPLERGASQNVKNFAQNTAAEGEAS
jgi:hypothetical protein